MHFFRKIEKYFLKENTAEIVIYIFIWGILIYMPVFLSQGYSTNWTRVYHEWVRLTPFLLIFLVNNFLLVPGYLFKKRKITYFILAFISVIFLSYLGTFNRYLHEAIFEPGMANPLPPELGRQPRPPGPWFGNFFMNVVVATLVVGFNTAIKMSSRWLRAEKKEEMLEKERTQTELAFLRNQISPHFFMNTLNNIHAMVDIDSKVAKESILRLSKLMRYLLYESNVEWTPIQK